MNAPLVEPVEYRNVKGFPEYRVGSDGSVWSNVNPGRRGTPPPDKWKRLKPGPSTNGHLTVVLGRGNSRYVHILVAEAFLGPRPSKFETRHLDGNPANNHVSNLAYGTPSENFADSVRHGTNYFKAGEHHPGARLKQWQVMEILSELQNGVKQAELAKRFSVSQCAISDIAHGKTWSQITGVGKTPSNN